MESPGARAGLSSGGISGVCGGFLTLSSSKARGGVATFCLVGGVGEGEGRGG